MPYADPEMQREWCRKYWINVTKKRLMKERPRRLPVKASRNIPYKSLDVVRHLRTAFDKLEQFIV